MSSEITATLKVLQYKSWQRTMVKAIACHRVAFSVATVIEHSIKHHIFKFVICAWYQPE